MSATPTDVQLVPLCGQCRAGAGGECHTPECALFGNRAPDIPTVEAFTVRPVQIQSEIGANTYMGAPITMRCPLCGEMDTFASNEHYFHAYKLTLLPGLPNQHGYYETIRDAKDPRTGEPSWQMAKRLGRGLPFTATEIMIWDWRDAVIAMWLANMAKYHQHEHCRRWLLDTGDAPLVEHRRDPIWGDNLDGWGMNLLGKILELVRARMRGAFG